jgi:hypothetical protein
MSKRFEKSSMHALHLNSEIWAQLLELTGSLLAASTWLDSSVVIQRLDNILAILDIFAWIWRVLSLTVTVSPARRGERGFTPKLSLSSILASSCSLRSASILHSLLIQLSSRDGVPALHFLAELELDHLTGLIDSGWELEREGGHKAHPGPNSFAITTRALSSNV